MFFTLSSTIHVIAPKKIVDSAIAGYSENRTNEKVGVMLGDTRLIQLAMLLLLFEKEDGPGWK